MENKNMLLEIPFATNLATQENLDDKCAEVQTLINEKIEEVKELIPSGSVDPTKLDEIKGLIQDDVIPAIDTVGYKIDGMIDAIQTSSEPELYDMEDLTLPEIPLISE